MERRLNDWLSSYMEYTDNSEPSPLYRRWVGIGTLAAATERKIWTPWDAGRNLYTNQFIALVGPSGRTRKGTAMRAGKDLLKELEVRIASQSTTREALIEELDQSFTTEVLDDKSSVLKHSSLTVFSEELTVFLGYNNHELMMDLTDWFDSPDTWRRRTKTQGTNQIEGVWLNLIGATTPKLIRSSLPEDGIGGGFTSRVIFVYASSKGKIVARPFVTDYERELRTALVHDLKIINSLVGQVTWSPLALDAYEKWYISAHESPPVDHHHFAGYNGRAQVHRAKVAILSSLSRNNKLVVTKEDFLRADRWLSEVEEYMPKTFMGLGQSRSAEVTNDMMVFIFRKEKTNTRELMREFYTDLDSKEHLDTVIEQLHEMNFCEVYVNGSGELTIKYNEENPYDDLFREDESITKLRGGGYNE